MREDNSIGRIDRSYKDLKQKQKSAIADKTYSMYIRLYLENHRMPNVAEKSSICRKLYATVQVLAPKTVYEEFCRIVDMREAGYEERILRDIQNGISLEKLNMKKQKKTPEEKAAILKMKRIQRRAKRQTMKNAAVENNTSQDDTFFYIAGYTSGGAPYGVTWEEMGLEPWQVLETEETEIEYKEKMTDSTWNVACI